MTVFRNLEKESFDNCPVWSFAENMQDYRPVLAPSPLPGDRGPLFIKAKFEAANGTSLEGYVVHQGIVYAVGIFVNGREFTFNRRLSDLAEPTLTALFVALDTEPFELFPLTFTTEFCLANGERVGGVFNFIE